jgi:small subunit ribosomal protein S20
MANHISAKKKARRDVAARLRNRANKSSLRTAVKKFRGGLKAGNVTEVAALLSSTQGAVDQACRKGVMHKNAANRTKSRLQKALNKAQAATA